MNYETTFSSDLKKIDSRELSLENIVEHFAANGYDFLYVYENERFVGVITFTDFLSGEYFKSRDRKFIRHFKEVGCLSDVEKIFEDNPEVERLVLIDDKDIVCEYNPCIELPLQNNVAKNLMALRYIRFFRKKIVRHLSNFDRILVIAKDFVGNFIAKILPEIKFDLITRINANEYDEKFLGYDLILDFYYGKRLRKMLGFKFSVADFSVIVERFALEELIAYCEKNAVALKFYKLQTYSGLNCLHAWEAENFQKRMTLPKLLINEAYVRKFATNDFEYEYIRKRKFFCSPRLDNGYCFTQSDCKTKGLTVSNGLRHSALENFNSTCVAHVYGPCTTFGILTSDFETVTSHLNKMFRAVSWDCSAINHGGMHGDNVLNSIMSALATPVKRGDMLIFLDVLDDFSADAYPNLLEVNDWFNQNKTSRDLMFFDFPGHCNSAANKIIAKGIFEDLSRRPLQRNIGNEKFTWFSLNHISINNADDFYYTNALSVKHRI